LLNENNDSGVELFYNKHSYKLKAFSNDFQQFLSYFKRMQLFKFGRSDFAGNGVIGLCKPVSWRASSRKTAALIREALPVL